ncbi:MAG TPA: type II secretion system protein N, partial [Myxococcota bacterium]|nr:type II secretion system protein N [Myxococcota bacterium]
MKSAMGSWLIMGLNVLLLGGSCFLVADIVTRIGAEALEPVPLASAPPDREAAPSDARLVAPSAILERNLFGAQLAGDVQALPPERDADEPLADTKLPLRLLGTAAASVEERSRAAIEDEKTRKHLVVAVGDSIEGHPRVSVAAIERTRVVLDNAGKREQLLLNEDQPLPQVAMARARPARRTAARPARTDTLNDRLQALSGEEGKGISEILSSARIV